MRSKFVFLEPWYATTDEGLLRELQRELSTGHPLHGVEMTVLARRQDRDDVLYAFNDRSGRVAQVHLTFSTETRPHFPATELFVSLETWAEVMRADNEEFL